MSEHSSILTLIIHFLLKWVVRAWIFAIVLVALYVSLMRYYLPQLDEYRQDIESLASYASGYDIKLGYLSGELKSLVPVIDLVDLEVRSKDQTDDQTTPPVFVAQARVAPSIKLSLKHRKPLFSLLQLEGVKLSLSEADDGRWVLLKSKVKKPLDIAQLIKQISSLDRADVKQFSYQLNYANGTQLESGVWNLQLAKQNEFRRLTLSNDSDDESELTQILLESQGDIDVDNLDVLWTLQSQNTNLSALMALFMRKAKVELSTNNVSLQGELHSTKSYSAQGTVALKDVRIETPSNNQNIGTRLLIFEELTTDLQWNLAIKKAKQEHVLWLANTEIKDGGINYSVADRAKVEINNTKQARHIKAQAPSLNGQAITRILYRGKQFGSKTQSFIKALDPKASFSDVQFFQSQIKEENAKRFSRPQLQLLANVNNASVKAHRGVPQIRRLSGKLWASDRAGVMQVKNLSGVSAYFEDTFDRAFVLDNLTSNFYWRTKPEARGGYIHSSNTEFKYKGAKVGGWFAIDIESDKPSLLSLNLGSKNLALQNYREILPINLSDDLRSWINTRVKQASLDNISFLLSGRVGSSVSSQDLNDTAARVMQIAATGKNIDVKYLDDWPEVKNAQGDLWLNQGDLQIDVSKGAILGTQIEQAQIKLEPDDIQSDINRLSLVANGKGDASDFLKLLRETNLSESLVDASKLWSMSGQARSEINMDLKLGQQNTQPVVNVRSQVSNANMDLGQMALSFTNINGTIVYDSEKGLSSENALIGRFDGLPTRVELSQQPCRSGKENSCTNVDVSGQVTAKRIQQWVDNPLMSYFTGQTSHQTSVQVGAADGSLDVLAQSNLKGLKSSLPAPFDKAAGKALPLTFKTNIRDELTKMNVFIPDYLNWESHQKNGKQVGSSLELSAKNQTELGVKAGILDVSGALKLVDIDQWYEVFDRYQKLSKSDGESSSNQRIAISKFFVGRLKYKQVALDNVLLALNETPDSFLLYLDGKSAKGRAAVSKTDEPLVVQLNHLNFDEIDIQQEETQQEASSGSLSPSKMVEAVKKEFDASSWPNVYFKVDEITWKKQDKGFAEFVLRKGTKNANSFVIKNIKANLLGVNIGGSSEQGGVYFWDSDSGSSFKGVLSTTQLNELLNRFGYGSVIQANKAHLDVHLLWQGSLLDFSLLKTQGRWDLKLENGSILAAPPSAAGASKVLSMINIVGILQNLQFTFDDLAKEGLSFRQLKTSVNSGAGVFETAKPIKITGGSSEINIDGFYNARTSKVDAELVLTIPVRGNLPWVIALVGGLPAAVGTFVFNKLMKKTVDQLSSLVYDVKGNVDQPEVKFKRLFNLKVLKKGDRFEALEFDNTDYFDPTLTALAKAEEPDVIWPVDNDNILSTLDAGLEFSDRLSDTLIPTELLTNSMTIVRAKQNVESTQSSPTDFVQESVDGSSCASDDVHCYQWRQPLGAFVLQQGTQTSVEVELDEINNEASDSQSNDDGGVDESSKLETIEEKSTLGKLPEESTTVSDEDLEIAPEKTPTVVDVANPDETQLGDELEESSKNDSVDGVDRNEIKQAAEHEQTEEANEVNEEEYDSDLLLHEITH